MFKKKQFCGGCDGEFRLQSYSDMRRHEDNFMTAETDLVSDFRR